jgi:hypothetical protein
MMETDDQNVRQRIVDKSESESEKRLGSDVNKI